MILNLTQHPASQEQLAAGVVDLDGPLHDELISALTFERLPSRQDVADAAERIARLTAGINPHEAMIGGAPWLMAPLEEALFGRGISPLYAFSVRESVEVVQPDGSVRKTAVFRHAGFVPAT